MSAHDAPSPIATPRAVQPSPRRSTSHCSPPGFAPRATRTPNSRRRSATRADKTANSPIPARASAKAEITPRLTEAQRSRRIEEAARSSSNVTSQMTRSGSTANAAPRTACAKPATGGPCNCSTTPTDWTS